VVSRFFPVALARGKHLFPFRTEKLSPSAPMVLGSQGPGRVGRRRFLNAHEPPTGRLVALLCPFGTNGPRRTPTAHRSTRKARRARRSRATLRRELARPQDTNTPAREAPPLQGVSHKVGSAESLDVDGSHCPTLPSRISATWCTRPGRPPSRPPSRPRGHPRAAGTSAPVAGRFRGAARLPVCSMNRTCVRTVGVRSDGTHANTCLCRIFDWLRVRIWLIHAIFRPYPTAMRIATGGLR
jgi:hypothetical protein